MATAPLPSVSGDGTRSIKSFGKKRKEKNGRQENEISQRMLLNWMLTEGYRKLREGAHRRKDRELEEDLGWTRGEA